MRANIVKVGLDEGQNKKTRAIPLRKTRANNTGDSVAERWGGIGGMPRRLTLVNNVAMWRIWICERAHKKETNFNVRDGDRISVWRKEGRTASLQAVRVVLGPFATERWGGCGGVANA